MTKPVPCLICGSENTGDNDAAEGSFVLCYDCWQSSAICATPEEAIENWNKTNKKE